MFERFLQAIKCLQLFYRLVIVCTFFSSTLYAQDTLPPLFIDPSIEAQLSIEQTFNDSSETLRPTVEPQKTYFYNEHKESSDQATPTQEKELIDPTFNLTQPAPRNIEFIPTPIDFTSEKSFEAPSYIDPFLTPLTPRSQEESLQTLWEKTFPKIPTQAPITDTIEQPSLESLLPPELPLDLPSESPLEPSLETNPDSEIVIEEVPEPSVEPKEILPVVTIVIDDLGYSREGMQSSLELPSEVTLAILPSTPFAEKTALASAKQSRTIILHAPMENTRKLELGPGGLYTNMEEEEFKKVLSQSISSIPGITGVNNHMGSLLTQDTERMQWVMEILQPLGLFFIDSVTSGQSVAYSEAQAMNITTVKRNVFLDNIRSEDAIHKQFERLIKIAKKDGAALAIGHPYPSTMDYLLKRLPQLEQEGIKLISIDDYMKRKKNPL